MAEADMKLYEAARKWMAKMQECDKKLEVLPWYTDDMTEDHLKSYKNIPITLYQFKKYFQRATHLNKMEGEFTLMCTFCTRNLSWWLKKENTNVFVKDIQSETTSRLGWLLFSFGALHIESLTKEISNWIGVEVAGRFKPILTDSWDPNIDPKKG